MHVQRLSQDIVESGIGLEIDFGISNQFQDNCVCFRLFMNEQNIECLQMMFIAVVKENVPIGSVEAKCINDKYIHPTRTLFPLLQLIQYVNITSLSNKNIFHLNDYANNR